MRKWLVGTVAVALVLGTAPLATAQEGVKTIIEKAIKAHGMEKLAKVKGIQSKAKGNMEIMGAKAEFTQETVIDLKGKVKETINVEFMGKKIPVVTAFDGTNAWISAMGMVQDLKDINEKLLDEMKEGVYAMEAGRMTTLLTDKKFTLAPLGEAKVNDRPTVGVKISSKGHRDINLYFDKENSLLAKTERRTLDGQTLQEVDEERIIGEYQDIEGQKVPKKIVVNHDGKKFMEAEVTEMKFLDKVDDSEFKKP